MAEPIERTPAGETPGLQALVYVSDADSEDVFRQSLADLDATSVRYSRGGVDRAVSELSHIESPRLLVVDITGVQEPTASIERLAQFCAPTTGVIVIGDSNDVVLYRNLKRSGIVEYFFKPLVVNLVADTCRYILGGDGPRSSPHAGRLITVLGVRGGAGATSIAVASAWHIAMEAHRHVALLDPDMLAGDMALQLDQLPNGTLSEALRQPDRVDEVFLDRGVIRVADRLDLLASLEPLGEFHGLAEDAVLSLLARLLARYRYVFLDLPAMLAAGLPRVLQLGGTVILVSDASLTAARDVARWRAAIGASTPERATLHLLNKADADGALPIEEFRRASGQAPDLVIRYDRDIAASSAMGAKGLARHHRLQHALAPMLEHITGEPAAPRSLLARLRG